MMSKMIKTMRVDDFICSNTNSNAKDPCSFVDVSFVVDDGVGVWLEGENEIRFQNHHYREKRKN